MNNGTYRGRPPGAWNNFVSPVEEDIEFGEETKAVQEAPRPSDLESAFSMTKYDMEKEVLQSLERAAELGDRRALAVSDAAARKAEASAIFPAELWAEYTSRMAAVDAELEAELEEIAVEVAALEDRMRYHVAVLGHTVKGSRLTAVYTPPRVTWDTRGLLGYAEADERVLAFRKLGIPSVAIRYR